MKNESPGEARHGRGRHAAASDLLHQGGKALVRQTLVGALAAALLIGASVRGGSGALAQSSPADFDLPGGAGHFYTQANGGAGPRFGYRITDEGGIRFWSEFQRLGGVAMLGYPVSQRFILDGFTVQATQKVVLQWRPELQAVDFVNVFDLLHDRGKDQVLQATYQIPPQLPASFDAGKTTSQVSRTRLGLLNDDLAIAARYYDGRPQRLAVLYDGLPTSPVAQAGPFTIVRAQRIAIQHWSVANPAAAIKAGDVTVVNGGDIAKQLGVIPSAATLTETSTGVINAATSTVTATPTAVPAPSTAPRPTPTAAPPAPRQAAAVAGIGVTRAPLSSRRLTSGLGDAGDQRRDL